MQQPRVAAQDIVKQWHERANDIIEASHSREKSSKKFDCAHEGCNWTQKQVTLQAYVVHLERKHRVKIRDTPDTDLLPVLSEDQ